MNSEAPVAARPYVVVGVSDSPAGREAVIVAAREAATRRGDLHLVRVWRDLCWFPSMGLADVATMRAAEAADRGLLAEALAVAGAVQPGVTVVADFVEGDLYATLVERAQGADMLVLGDSAGPEAPSRLGGWFQRHVACRVLTVDPDGFVFSGSAPQVVAAV